MTRGPATLVLAAAALWLAACGEARQADTRPGGCNACHGGADNLTGAPPMDLAGHTDTARVTVGAHTSHVQAGPLAGAIACTECHPDPRFGSSVHANGTVNVAFGSLAGQGTTATWDPGTATCSTYCHGATLGGGTSKAPVWTQVGAGEADCGTCHGVPPPLPHPAVPSNRTVCGVCHPETVDGHGDIIAGGKHLDGQVERQEAHPPSWLDTASPGFHAYSANAGLASCQTCHGQDLDGGFTGVACAQCHDASLPPGVTSWKTNCVMCHGGTDNQTGAPPKATWGQGGDPIRIGAHTSHVTGSAIAPPFDCGVCHVKPADALAAGHVDQATATVTFGGLALPTTGPAPAWDRAAATCASTYCHGATLAGGTNATPVWTSVGQGQAACGTCHGLPPPAPHPVVPADLTLCSVCHSLTMDGNGNLIAPSAGGKHLDGIAEASGGHDTSWMDTSSPGFHAYSANRGLASCQICHGPNLDGVGGFTSVGCGQCHDARLPPGVTSWKVNCVMCHGGVDNQTGAPPKATWGQGGDPIRIGAHTSHVTGSAIAPPFACGLCHVKPADALSPGHIDQPTATVAFSGLALPGTGPAPAWTRSSATCSSTYCHGAILAGGTNTTPVWTSVGQGQAACGTCHGLPPPTPHPAVTGGLAACWVCHQQTMDSGGNLIPPGSGGAHLDGTVEAGHPTTWMDQTSAGFHAYSANRDIASCTACHGADLSGGLVGVACNDCHRSGGPASDFATCTACHGGTDNQTGAPPRATWGNTDPVAVGAHTSHVAATHALALPFDCTACHVKPASLLSANHVDGTVTVTGYTGSDPALIAAVTDPGWSLATATCASAYCHGATLQGGTTQTPTWTTVDGSQVACGTCHGVPPPTGLHPDHVAGGAYYANANCSNCHSGIATGSAFQPPVTNGAIVGPALHVNGTSNVVFGGTYGGFPVQGCPTGTTITWDPTTRTCSNVSCHRLDPQGCVGPFNWGP